MMKKLKDRFARCGLRVPSVMLPSAGIDLSRFAVIACDQHSAEPEYWEETERIVGPAPSSLRLMLPEAWLSRKAELEPVINASMHEYLENGTLADVGRTFIYVKRQIGTKIDGSPLYRHGLVAAIDLDAYDYQKGNHALIRATEKTVPSRLPERIAIRDKAPLEMPHILVLLNDRQNLLSSCLEALVSCQQSISSSETSKPLYDFDLMQQGGHLTGYRMGSEAALTKILEVMESLKEEADTSQDGMLMAVGDGNHSLAAAKACWEKRKAQITSEVLSSGGVSDKAALQKILEEKLENEPLHYALVELVSAYDEGLSIYPIHRLLMHLTDEEHSTIEHDLGLDGPGPLPSLQMLQPRIDHYLEEHPGVELEYIHDASACRRLGHQTGNFPILFEDFPRDSIFSTVLEHGLFVRKSFSLGQANEKRYYLETRRLR